MVLLMLSLFWALWDEAFGQRPWKAYQEEWKHRYTAFLKTATSSSAKEEAGVTKSSDYQALEADYKRLKSQTQPDVDRIQRQLTDLNAKILSVQSVFTDRRAYVNALTYEMETDTSASGRKSKQNDIDQYKKQVATVEYPNGHREK